ncbi:hypothetical protein L1987_30636 [Smallanthus sonchifolius]|uniref:Uncharacterized protein n=1 Tax=Smallanthus sonchifolius TaxID=185202 RepID=A0ACB9I4J9_9ASTR|nr:hypothetical protein L1987_30636 [Smallanthus sonchifolius]
MKRNTGESFPPGDETSGRRDGGKGGAERNGKKPESWIGENANHKKHGQSRRGGWEARESIKQSDYWQLEGFCIARFDKSGNQVRGNPPPGRQNFDNPRSDQQRPPDVSYLAGTSRAFGEVLFKEALVKNIPCPGMKFNTDSKLTSSRKNLSLVGEESSGCWVPGFIVNPVRASTSVASKGDAFPAEGDPSVEIPENEPSHPRDQMGGSHGTSHQGPSKSGDNNNDIYEGNIPSEVVNSIVGSPRFEEAPSVSAHIANHADNPGFGELLVSDPFGLHEIIFNMGPIKRGREILPSDPHPSHRNLRPHPNPKKEH